MINNSNAQNPQWKFIFHLGMPENQSLDCKKFYLGNAFLATVSYCIWAYF